MSKIVSAPSMSGIKTSAVDYAAGFGGNMLYQLLSRITGSGLIGGAIAAILTGSVIAGERGRMLATLLGFQSGANMNLSGSTGTTAGGNVEVM
jgi:hypothetical protein